MRAGGAARVEVNVLGPSEVRVDGQVVSLGKPQVHRLLAALALHHPLAAPDTLIELLWSTGNRPQYPERALYTYVSNLRARLRSVLGDHEVVRRATNGYGLSVPPVELDTARFAAELDAAWAHLATQPAKAADHFAAARRLWRGVPYTGLEESPEALAACNRLTEQYLSATEHLAELRLAQGAGPELVAELDALVARHPLREPLWNCLSIALYRSGGQAEALERIDQLRTLLRDELGVSPSPETCRIELAILDHDTDVLVARREPLPAHGRSEARLPRALAALDATPFEGRHDAIGALDRWWAGDAPLAIVSGEPGAGKSRLAARFAGAASERGTAVVYLATSPVFAERGSVGDLEQALSALAHEAAATQLPTELRHVLGRDDTEAPLVASNQPGDVERSALGYAIGALAQRAASRYIGGLLVVLDDAHWADDSILELFDRFASAAPGRVRALLTMRDSMADTDTSLGACRARWLRSESALEVHLDALDSETVSTLVLRRIPGASPDLVRRIDAETAGNALFVTALVDHYVAHPDTLARQPVPSSIVAVIDARLEELDAGTRAVLRTASVLGSAFRARMLEVACAQDGDTIDRALTAAADAGLLMSGSEGDERWRHSIVRDAIYESMTPRARVHLHRSVAERLEAHFGDDLDAVVGDLARHHAIAAVGSSPAGAIRFGVLAARRALAAYRYDDALATARTARSLLDVLDTPQAFDLVSIELWALLGLGRGDDVDPIVTEVWPDAVRFASPEQLADLVWHLGTTAFGDRRRVELVEALSLVEHHPYAHARVLVTLASFLSEADHEAAAQYLDAACAASEGVSEPSLLYELTEATLSVRWVHDDPTTRARRADEMVRLALAQRRLDRLLLAHSWQLVVGYERADLTMVDRAAARHRELAEKLRVPRYLAGARQREAARLVLEGRFGEAERVAALALEQDDGAEFLAGYGAQLVAIRTEQDRAAELRSVLSAFDPPPGMGADASWRATKALIDASAGDVAAAGRTVASMLGDGAASRPDMFMLTTLSVLGETTCLTGDLDHARLLRARLLPFDERVVVVGTGAVVWGAVARFVAALDLLLGDHDAALEHAAQALVIHERLGARPFIARDRLTIATALIRRADLGDADRARDLAGRARVLARHLGMPSVERAATELDASVPGR